VFGRRGTPPHWADKQLSATHQRRPRSATKVSAAVGAAV
jgi:hypothetical protein